MQYLTVQDIWDRIQISRSTIYNKTNPKTRWYDPDFPPRLKMGGVTRFSEEGFNAWLAKKAGVSQVIPQSENSDGVPAEKSVRPSGVQPDDHSPQKSALGAKRRASKKSKSDSLLGAALSAGSTATVPPLNVDLRQEGTTLSAETSAASEKPDLVASPVAGTELSNWDLIQSMRASRPAESVGAGRVQHQSTNEPEWLPELTDLLERLAGSGTSIGAGMVFVSEEDFVRLRNPDAEMLKALDAIDARSYQQHGVLLTAVLYDYPEQSARLDRAASALGLQGRPHLLYEQRVALLGLYGAEMTKRQLAEGESPRNLRRLQLLRRWSHEQVTEVLTRSPRARRSHGAGAPRRVPLAVGGH